MALAMTHKNTLAFEVTRHYEKYSDYFSAVKILEILLEKIV